jgi:phage gpG-like protein
MDFKSYFKAILTDLQVELSDEFDRNFERKAFFDRPWPQTKWPNNRGSLMQRTGAGRKSIRGKVAGDNIVWRSSLPYMGIHNEGGEIVVTAQMRKFFWAMYYKASGGITYRVSNRQAANTQRNRKLSQEAAIWKSLALLRPGTKIKIPKRQFIGDHPLVDQAVSRVVDHHVKHFSNQFLNLKSK